MSQKFITVSVLVSAITGVIAALAVCLVFFFFFYKPVQNAKTMTPAIEEEPSATPKKTEFPLTPSAEIEESAVTSVTLETVYKGFFDENSKCRKTYNEVFGDKDGVYSPSSPCRINITFNRDGRAEKSIEIRRYDSASKNWRVAEKTIWKSKVSAGQFKKITESVLNNDAFKSWRDGTMINVSNSSVTVRHTNGSRTPMSNVDEKTTVFLSMMDAFKQLDKQLDWEKIQ